MMRVLAPPADSREVHNLRTRWPAEALAERGQIELLSVEDGLQLRQAVRREGPNEIVGLKDLPEADVVVFTRLLAGPLVETMELLQREGIAVVVDIDDDFRNISQAMGSKINPTTSPHYNWRHLTRACSQADFVTCSTPALRTYAPHGRVAVIPNAVPDHYVTIPRPADNHTVGWSGRTVGWSGAVNAHHGDLNVTRGGVAAAVEETGSNFLVVGSGDRVRLALGLKEEPTATGIVEHEVYPYSLSRLDVGIAPLADTAYNRSKSWLKPLEYTALGIPWVGSPSIEYMTFFAELERFAEGFGAIAQDRSRNWRRKTTRALTLSEGEREDLSVEARRFVAVHHTVKHRCHLYAEAWSRAMEHRRSEHRYHV